MNMKKYLCLMCDKVITLNRNSRLKKHRDENGNPCPYSGKLQLNPKGKRPFPVKLYAIEVT